MHTESRKVSELLHIHIFFVLLRIKQKKHSIMDYRQTIFGSKSRLISQIILVTICIVLISFFMPREKSIGYAEPECNTIWTGEDVKAGFYFEVKKNDTQLKTEKDKILENIPPLFRFDRNIGAKYSNELGTSIKKAIPISIQPIVAAQISNNFRVALMELYRRGIVADSEIDVIRTKEDGRIRIANKEKEPEMELHNAVSESEAYDIIAACDTTGIIPADFDFGKFIVPNYTYDKAKTEKRIEDALKGVSPTMAIVRENQTIIEDGQMVDSLAYWKLKTYFGLLKEQEKADSNWFRIFIGQIAFIIIAMFSLLAYLYIYRNDIVKSTNKFVFTILSATIFPILVGILGNEHALGIFMLPFAIVPMLLCLFIDHTTAFVTHLTSIVICSLMLASPYEFLLLQLLAGNAAILSLKELSSRSQMFRCVIITFLTYSIVYLCYEVIMESDLSGMNYSMYIYFVISAFLMLFIYPLMFVVEKAFGFISNVTLIELSNLNSKLLQRMSQETPGTFQHSMQVGNLAAEAARAIGANSLEVRTGALYHDLGKLEDPIYFTENQNGGISPHAKLDPIESAQRIIGHVTNGLAMAEKEKLPKKIREFITTHHGLSKTGYFYITYKNAHPDEDIDERLFTYPGPRPTTREQAILMMADCVEAASHSLKEYTEENIDELVNKLIDARVADKELSLSPLTFQDIDTIKNVFKKRLMAIYHTRISYPSEKKKKEEQA